MDIILRNGDKLYKEHLKRYKDIDDLIEKLDLAAGNFLAQSLKNSYMNYKLNISKPYNVYGDNFKIKITPKNIESDCVLSIEDYDEHQLVESEIRINFNKDELKQFINLLKIVESKL